MTRRRIIPPRSPRQAEKPLKRFLPFTAGSTRLKPNPCSWSLEFHTEAADENQFGWNFSTATQLVNGQLSLSKTRAHHCRCGPRGTASRMVVYPPLRLMIPPVVKIKNRSVAAVTLSIQPKWRWNNTQRL